MGQFYFHRQFITDLETCKDKNLFVRVVLCVLDELKGSPNNTNDHRFEGIPGAWIRYVTRGRTGYRIIYLRDGSSVIFYRCGEHSVEDKTTPPDPSEELGPAIDLDETDVEEMTLPNTFLANHSQKMTLTALVGRRLIPNKAAWLVAPYLSQKLLSRTAPLGMTLDTIVRERRRVAVITQAEQVDEYEDLYKDLAARDIELLFVPGLHSKIYLFLTDESYPHRSSSVPSLGIVGSANLTTWGIAANRGLGNQETNYTVPIESIPELTDIVENFYIHGIEFYRAKKQYSKKEARR